MHGGKFYLNTATYTKERFIKEGAVVYEYKELKINGYPAKYTHLQGTPPQKGFSLVFGDTTFSIMIMSLYDPADEAAEKELRQSLLSIYYDKTTIINPLETARFTLDETEAPFKLSDYAAGMHSYRPRGTEAREDSLAPFVMVMIMPNPNNLVNAAGLCVYNLERYGAKITSVIREGFTTINGNSAYEVEFHAEIKSQD